ncbi:unnamed protein product [Laminaria digitata]
MGFTTPVSPASSASAAAAAAAAAKGGASSSRSRAAPPPRADSALHRAVRSRDCDRLEELLGSGQDPSATDVCGRGPLHVAARLGNVEVVQILLRAKAAVDARDKASLTPLLTASKEGKAEVVEALLKGGAAPNLKDSRGHSALFNAVELRFLAVVKALVSGGASVNAGGQKGLTPLHLACEQGPVSIVEVLLSAGALPGHCWNDTLRSPLFGACIAGSLDAVNLLLPLLSKRQINMRDRMLNLENAGSTALMTAIMCNRGEMDIIQAASCWWYILYIRQEIGTSRPSTATIYKCANQLIISYTTWYGSTPNTTPPLALQPINQYSFMCTDDVKICGGGLVVTTKLVSQKRDAIELLNIFTVRNEYHWYARYGTAAVISVPAYHSAYHSVGPAGCVDQSSSFMLILSLVIFGIMFCFCLSWTLPIIIIKGGLAVFN